jgi:serine/threonine-protein kinase
MTAIADRREAPRRQRAANPTVELAIHVRPYAQRALLDGVEVARGEQRVVFAIPAGRHLVRVEHECCAPYVREIDAREAARLGDQVPLGPRLAGCGWGDPGPAST